MLELTEEQIATLKPKDEAFMREAQSIQDHLDQARVDLERVFHQHPVSADTARTAALNVAGVQNQFQTLMIGAQIEMRGILTAVQRQKLPVHGLHRPPLFAPPSPFGLWRDYASIEQFGLTDAQINQLKEKDAAYVQYARSFGESMREAQSTLDKILAGDSVDMKAIEPVLSRLADLHEKEILLETEARQNLQEILPASQPNRPPMR